VIGTLINVATVLVGATLGVALGGRLPDRVRRTVTDTIGLFTLVIGVQAGLDAFGGDLSAAVGRAGVIVVLGSLLVGGVLGEVASLEGRLERAGEALHRRSGAGGDAGRFVEGFVAASVLFCTGPLTVLGSVRDGLSGDYQLLAIKSTLDGFAALALASSLGIGVAFSVITVLVVQGGIAGSAALAGDALSPAMIAAANAAGGVMIVAIGVRLLELRDVAVANLLPALVLAPLVVAVLP